MEGKVGLITGGARGLGRQFAEELLTRGAKVCIVDILEQEGPKAETELRRKFGKDSVSFLRCDVTCGHDLEEAFKHTIAAFGRLDIVVNNAGIEEEDQWERMIDINLVAVIRGTMLGIQYMSPPSGEGGVIINVSSAAGVFPVGVVPGYTAAKHGVVGYTRSIGGQARRSHNVRVNCLCPTLVQTKMVETSDSFGLIDPKEIMSLSAVGDCFMRLVESKLSAAVMLVTPQGKHIIKMPKTIEEAFEKFAKL